MFKRCNLWLKDMQRVVWNVVGTEVGFATAQIGNYITTEMSDAEQLLDQGGGQQAEVAGDVQAQDPNVSHWEMELDEGVYMDDAAQQQNEDESLGPEVLDQFQWP